MQLWIYTENFRAAKLSSFLSHFLPYSQLPTLTQPWFTKIQLSCISSYKKNQKKLNPIPTWQLRGERFSCAAFQDKNNDILLAPDKLRGFDKTLFFGELKGKQLWDEFFSLFFFFPPWLSHRNGNTAPTAASVLLIKAKAPKGLLEAHNGFVIILFITLRQLVGTGVFLMSLEEMIRRIITSSPRSQEGERGVCRYWDNPG